MTVKGDLARIRQALHHASELAHQLLQDPIQTFTKESGDPVTIMDTQLDALLKQILPLPGDGWLSEESVDDLSRLEKSRVWIVDPLDGTREFVAGIDEWSISIALAVEGQIVAAGICNPLRNEHFTGALEPGIPLNDAPAKTTPPASLDGITVLASRSELKRGQWDCFDDSPIQVIPMGSVAYKLARVAAGLNDATFSLAPKSEWDIAAGVMLTQAAGGTATDLNGAHFTFNNPQVLVNGLIAAPRNTYKPLKNLIKTRTHPPEI